MQNSTSKEIDVREDIASPFPKFLGYEKGAVKIFGERNTGTNALSQFIAQNSESLLLPGTFFQLPKADPSVLKHKGRGETEKLIDLAFSNQPPTFQWKHCATNFTDEDLAQFRNCTTLILLRNPISWCLALWKNPYNGLVEVPRSFDEFVNVKWKTVGRERLDLKVMSPSDLINLKMSYYKEFVSRGQKNGHSMKVLRFENLVCSPLSVWTSIKADLSNPKDDPALIERSTKDPTKNLQFYKAYYSEGKWKSEISENTYNLLNKRIDWNLYRDLLDLH
jgi:hypothetical protein